MLCRPASKASGLGCSLLPIDVRTLEERTRHSRQQRHATPRHVSVCERHACLSIVLSNTQVDKLVEYGLLVYDEEGRGTAYPSGSLEFETPVATSDDAL